MLPIFVHSGNIKSWHLHVVEEKLTAVYWLHKCEMQAKISRNFVIAKSIIQGLV